MKTGPPGSAKALTVCGSASSVKRKRVAIGIVPVVLRRQIAIESVEQLTADDVHRLLTAAIARLPAVHIDHFGGRLQAELDPFLGIDQRDRSASPVTSLRSPGLK